MDEVNISKCKRLECGKLVVRKQDGFFPDGKNKRFVNEEGKLWNGKVCPDCTKSKAKTHIKEKRKNAKRSDNVQD